ncbi:MAG: serine/threonine protein kinase [Myxococcales bacterium]|nr:serine/threonine protein kinase [Myxococcales bacterium]
MVDHRRLVSRGLAETLPEPEHQTEPELALEADLARARIRSALFPSHAPTPTIGRFRVVDRLGAGGMGVVYLAHDPELDRRVAIKVLRERGGGREAASRLQREAQAIARVAHPNVVAVHETGVHEGAVFVVMEHVEGRSLRTWLEEHARTPAEILDVFAGAGAGLAAAHAVGLVHRDFKPENVIVGADGRPRVLDFGLARSVLAEQLVTLPTEGAGPLDELTRTGAVLGTPSYMSPEQFLGGRLSPASDQFSFY